MRSNTYLLNQRHWNLPPPSGVSYCTVDLTAVLILHRVEAEFANLVWHIRCVAVIRCSQQMAVLPKQWATHSNLTVNRIHGSNPKCSANYRRFQHQERKITVRLLTHTNTHQNAASSFHPVPPHISEWVGGLGGVSDLSGLQQESCFWVTDT